MATGATIYKIDLQISNMDSHYYEGHTLTIAKHPSETDERLMVRILAFALYAHERLEFGKGLSDQDEPALWLKSLTGSIDLWIEVGLVNENRMRKACSKSDNVVLILYGSKADHWWKQNKKYLCDNKKLTVIMLPYESTQALATLARRQMELTCTIEDGHVTLLTDEDGITFKPTTLQ